MSTPILELIAENIKTSINAITVGNGYNQTLIAIRPRRIDYQNPPWDDLWVLIEQTDREKGEPAHGTEIWMQRFILSALVIDSDSATASIDTRINQVAADLEKKLKSDRTRGGSAIETEIENMRPLYDTQGRSSGLELTLKITYRTVYLDPFTQM